MTDNQHQHEHEHEHEHEQQQQQEQQQQHQQQNRFFNLSVIALILFNVSILLIRKQKEQQYRYQQQQQQQQNPYDDGSFSWNHQDSPPYPPVVGNENLNHEFLSSSLLLSSSSSSLPLLPTQQQHQQQQVQEELQEELHQLQQQKPKHRRLQQQQEQLSMEDVMISKTTTTTTTTKIRPTVLLGIFVDDSTNGYMYRQRYRELFQTIWKQQSSQYSSRICTLDEYQQMEEKITVQMSNNNDNKDDNPCELVYTFVLGANKDPKAPTEIVSNTTTTAVIMEKPIATTTTTVSNSFFFNSNNNNNANDLNEPDMTLLNIRENVNDGKAQTFFYYASLLHQQQTQQRRRPSFDYVLKMNGNAMLMIPQYFQIVSSTLPPAPYNTNMYLGILQDKSHWTNNVPDPADMNRLESFWGNEFEGVHLYMQSHAYLVSIDLAEFIAKEAPFSKVRIGPGGYLEGQEDHDIAAMIFHSPTPIHVVTMSKSLKFWKYPIQSANDYETFKQEAIMMIEQAKNQ